ncbi:MAG: hypothetical protein ABI678_16225 [Kofleriaceae bacterium]
MVDESLEDVEASANQGETWIAPALRSLELANGMPSLTTCIVVPAPPTPPAKPAASAKPEATNVAVTRAILAHALAGRSRVETSEGDAWKLSVVVGPCPAPAVAPPAH